MPIEKDDRVTHKKHGEGTVEKFTKFGTRGRYAKVNFDGLDEPKWIVPTRLKKIVVIGLKLDAEAREKANNQDFTGRDRSVDYAALEKAKRVIGEQYPDADLVKAFVYHDGIYCEVWKDGHATAVPYDDPTRKRRGR